MIGRRPDGTDDIKICGSGAPQGRRRLGARSEVPLGEETEAYEVEILDGATVKRIAWPSTLAVKVYQLSATFGRGTPAEATLFFPLPVEI
jgi:hypothetical protein